MKGRVRTIAAVLAVLACFSALSHRVIVYAWKEGDVVKGTGYLGSGGRCKGSDVSLLSADGKVIARGKTNEKGEFTLKIPTGTSPAKVVLDAGMGHRAEFVLAQKDDDIEKKEKKAGEGGGAGEGRGGVAVDEKELRRVLGEVLDERLAPILDAQSRARVSDVLGGIGYIVGVFGLLALLGRRRGGGGAG